MWYNFPFINVSIIINNCILYAECNIIVPVKELMNKWSNTVCQLFLLVET